MISYCIAVYRPTYARLLLAGRPSLQDDGAVRDP